MSRCRRCRNDVQPAFQLFPIRTGGMRRQTRAGPPTALRVAEVFGGGMGRMGLTCGAVTGAFMAIGLKHAKLTPEDDASRKKSVELSRQFREKFEARHGSICCKDLLGVDLSKPDGYQQAIDRGVFVSLCPKLVHDAVEIVEELLGPPANTQ